MRVSGWLAAAAGLIRPSCSIRPCSAPGREEDQYPQTTQLPLVCNSPAPRVIGPMVRPPCRSPEPTEPTNLPRPPCLSARPPTGPDPPARVVDPMRAPNWILHPTEGRDCLHTVTASHQPARGAAESPHPRGMILTVARRPSRNDDRGPDRTTRLFGGPGRRGRGRRAGVGRVTRYRSSVDKLDGLGRWVLCLGNGRRRSGAHSSSSVRR